MYLVIINFFIVFVTATVTATVTANQIVRFISVNHIKKASG